MNRVLSTTGTVAGDGLLKRALSLRRSAQLRTEKPSQVDTLVLEPAALARVNDEKKKLWMPYSEKVA